MRITFSLLIAYCTLTASLAAAQQVHVTPRIQPPARAVAAAAGQWIEVTRTDITQLDRPLRASELRTLGVALGDPEEQARAALESQGLQVRPNNLGGYAVNDAAGNQLMALKIISGHIEQISWLPALASRLAGRAALLFDPSVSDPDSPLRLQLLGREDRRTTESVGGSLFVTYSYDPEGIRLHFPGEHAVVALVFPAKKRQ